MIARWADLLDARFGIPPERTTILTTRFVITMAAVTFVLTTTLIVAFDSIFPRVSGVSTLNVGDVAPRDIVAPTNVTYTSDFLTQIERARARESVDAIYTLPDPDIIQQQTQTAQQILNFMRDVRLATYDSDQEKSEDLNEITALDLEPHIVDAILRFDDATWEDIEEEVLTVLPRVMRSAREDQLQAVRDQLPTQVAVVRFNRLERDVIVAIIEDLIRPNTFENVSATEAARDAAAEAVAPVQRRFVTGERIVEAGSTVSESDYEALEALGLLRTEGRRLVDVLRALLASIIVMVISGLFLARYTPDLLYNNPRLLTLLAAIFLIMLAVTRIMGSGWNIYLFPAAAIALIYVAISNQHVAIIGSLGLALLIGLTTNNSLEITTLISMGGLAGALVLRNPQRLNAFFVAGAIVGVTNAAVIGLFALATTAPSQDGTLLAARVGGAFLNGALLVPATVIAVMYVVTALFNLPTALRLLDLSQPNKPLLQRLLREAPGSYQHSLQVANLAEQAANAIGADAQLTHVAALYHDIGKVRNPLYFTENQQEHIGNPHDTLNDPYRSADIIIDHVTGGDEIARQQRLPQRLRDFIREHHGTTQVFVFYQRALKAVGGDESQVDIADFTYPGPRPRSKETAILMLADSCEAAVRSSKPESKAQISQIVRSIINSKRDDGQLDDSNLTLSDLRRIQTVFVDILQSMFHPRINYRDAVSQQPKPAAPPAPKTPEKTPPVRTEPEKKTVQVNGELMTGEAARPDASETVERPRVGTSRQPAAPGQATPAPDGDVFDEAPMTEVPRLPTSDRRRATGNMRKVNLSDSTETSSVGPVSSEENRDQTNAPDEKPEESARKNGESQPESAPSSEKET